MRFAVFVAGFLSCLAGHSAFAFHFAVAPEARFRVRIELTDAETGERIKECSVVPAPWRTGSVTWQQQYRQKLVSSNVFTMERGWDPTGLRIESPGYLTHVTEPLPRQTDHVLKIKLKKDPGIRGTILSPDGKPVADVSIALCTWTREVLVENGAIRYGRGDRYSLLKSKKDGQFSLPSEIDPWVLVFAHELGYAERTREQLAKDQQVRLQKWGRVEGRARIGKTPLKNLTIDMNAGRGDVQVVLHYSAEAKCNNKGEFSADRLPPVKMYVKPIFQIGERKLSPLWFSGLTKIKSGDVTQLDIPRLGQDIIGQIELPKDSRLKFKDLRFDVTCYLRPPSMRMRQGGTAFEDYQTFTRSEFGKHFRKNNIPVSAQGTIEIEGLLETAYVLQIRASLKTDAADARPRLFMAKRIDLKPKTAESPVIDLGTLTLRKQ